MSLKSNSAFQKLISLIHWILGRKCQKSVICPVTYCISSTAWSKISRLQFYINTLQGNNICIFLYGQSLAIKSIVA